MLICSENRFDVADRLLSLGCEINAQDDEGSTALMSACFAHNIELIRLLLERGADPLMKDHGNRRPVIVLTKTMIPRLRLFSLVLIFSLSLSIKPKLMIP